jgi:hypothetical protein
MTKEIFAIQDIKTGALLIASEFGFTKTGGDEYANRASFSSTPMKTNDITNVVKFSDLATAKKALKRIGNTVKHGFVAEEKTNPKLISGWVYDSRVNAESAEVQRFGVVINKAQIVGTKGKTVERKFKIVKIEMKITIADIGM